MIPAQKDDGKSITLYGRALNILIPAIQKFPANGNLMTMKGMCFLAFDDVDKAEDCAALSQSLEKQNNPQTDLLIEECKRYRLLNAAMRRQAMAASHSSTVTQAKEPFKNAGHDDDNDLAAQPGGASRENEPAVTDNFTAEEAAEKAYALIRQAQNLQNNTHLYRDAHAILMRAVARHSQNSNLLAMGAHCLLLLRHYEHAIDWANKAIKLDSHNATALTVLFECEEKRSAALALRLPPIRVSNSSWIPDTVLVAVEAILNLEKPEEHIADIERLSLMAEAVLQIFPRDPNAVATKTFCSIVQGNTGDILKLLRAPLIEDRTQELIKQALPLLEKTLQKNPVHKAALTLKAGCLSLMAQHEQMHAVATYVMSIQINPSTFKPDQILAILTGLAGSKQSSEAPLAAAEELLKSDPKNRVGLIAKVEMLRLRQQFHEASQTLTLAIKYYPQDDFFWALRALCCLFMNDPYALVAADHSLSLNRDNNDLGWLAKLTFLAKTGEKDKMIAAVREATGLFPDNQLLKLLLNYYQSQDQSKLTQSQDADE